MREKLGPLEDVACNKVNCKKIATRWPDVCGWPGRSSPTRSAPTTCCRMFGREGHPTPLGAAFAEYGRIDKTMHLLALVDPVDDTYRRLMNRQLTVQESRHRLARAICHGGRGQIRQAYREGQEDQLAALGLVLNAVVLWNTRYLDAAVVRLRSEGHDIKDEDVARLSPLKDRHINFLGRYLFNLAASGPGQDLRPFRDPNATEDGDEE
ncbi:Tn3 family transposase [Streptomyces sp. NPDC091217]|uniref:Tn3 family transposase n=1 Tax=Streptomyces sp. NPDC091217 TaxID=3365975 RepID=UPI003812DDBB